MLRMLIGISFIPTGLKKLLKQPFTDRANTGVFLEFLHAFHAGGPTLPIYARPPTFGRRVAYNLAPCGTGCSASPPILAAICVLCWSTGVVPTAIVVTLMSVGLLALLLWDIQRWNALLGIPTPALPAARPVVTMRLWNRCGWLILFLYFGNTAITGQVYRPMGVEWSNPSFIVLLIIAMLPVVTFALDSSPAEE